MSPVEPKLCSQDELDRMRLWSMFEWDPDVDGEREAWIAHNQIEALYAHIAALDAALQPRPDGE